MKRCCQIGMLFATCASWPAGLAQEAVDRLAGSANSEASVAAQVDSAGVLAYLGQQPITQREVDFVLGRGGLRSGAQSDLPRLSFAAEQAAIGLIASQKQALQTLRKQGMAANREQVENWIRNSVQSPTAADPAKIVAEIALRNTIDAEVYWELVAFRLSWKGYLAKHLTTENIARHFTNQSSRFDGTRFQIQILSVAVPAGKSARRDTAAKALAAVHDSLATKTIEPNELQKLASDRGWQVSEEMWIDGSGSLDPSAVDALLKLMIGKISQPVHTASGVHLIRLIDKQPGELELEQVKDEVRAHLLVYLLNYLASLSQEQLPLIAIE